MQRLKGLTASLSLPTNVRNDIIAIRAIQRCNLLPLSRLVDGLVLRTTRLQAALRAMGDTQYAGQSLHRLDCTHVSNLQGFTTLQANVQLTTVHNRRRMVQFSRGSHGQLLLCQDGAILP